MNADKRGSEKILIKKSARQKESADHFVFFSDPRLSAFIRGQFLLQGFE
jgi:hypothetical protein